MADVLSQSEVESLLAALDSGIQTTQVAAAAPSSDRVTSQGRERPQRASREQLRAIGTLHDEFSREFSAGLSGLLRTICEVKLARVDQLTYAEFVSSLPSPTCFSLIESKGLEGHILLDLNPQIVFPIVDRLLGGGRGTSGSAPQRPLTEIELRLASRVIDLALRALENAWQNVCDLRLSVVQTESHAQRVQIMPPDEVVVLVSFEVEIAEERGMLNLCIPFNTIAASTSRLNSESCLAHQGKSIDHRQPWNSEGGDSRETVNLSVRLASTTLTTADLLNLEVGDVILTDHESAAGVEVRIDDRPVFHGFPGVYKGQKAIRIGQELQPPEAVIKEQLNLESR
jgi:flagellar motor switch protein FliM